MNAFLSLGRWLFALPFAIFGLFHFLNAQGMADQMVPTYMPAKAIWVYLAGAGLIAASISIVSGKYDKLATTLLAAYLLLMILMIHAPNAMDASNPIRSQGGMTNVLKDIALAGAAMLFAQHLSKDRSLIG